jgi:hypothetical protein
MQRFICYLQGIQQYWYSAQSIPLGYKYPGPRIVSMSDTYASELQSNPSISARSLSKNA